MFFAGWSATSSVLRRLQAAVPLSLAALLAATSCTTRSWELGRSQSENLVTANGTITQAADEMRGGWFWDQPQLDPATVGSGNFKRLFKTQLQPGVSQETLAEPLVIGNRVLVATESNNIYLVDAQSGAVVASRNVGPAFSPQANGIGCGDILPTVGITGTPVVDNSAGTAYFYSKSAAGAWSLHAVSVTDLSERSGFPVVIGGAAQNDPSATFNSLYEHQRPGLLLMNGVVYAGFGAHCDIGGYRGWIVGVSTSGVIKTRFTTIANSGTVIRGNGVWMAGSGLASDGTGQVLFSTGNGSGTPYPGPLPGSAPTGNLAEAVVRAVVQSDGSLKPTDFFAPFNAVALNGGDSDLGSGGVVVLPSQFGTAAIPHLAVIAGKGGDLYLLNRDKLGGFAEGSGGGDAVLAVVPLGGATWSRPAVWPGEGGYIYVTTNGGTSTTGFDLQVLKYGANAAGNPTVTVVGKAPQNFGAYSGSPVVTSNGTSAGSALVWVTSNTGALRVYDAVPVTGALNLRFMDGYGNQAKFTTVGVGAGKVYVGTGDGYLVGYGVGATSVTGSPLDFGTVTLGKSVQLTATITASTGVTVTALSSSNGVFALGTPSPSLPATLAAGQTLTVPVTFTPAAASSYSASLNVTTSGAPGALTMIGVGQASGPDLVATPANINFGGIAIGTSKSLTVSLQNAGNQTLTFSGFTAPAAPFSVTGVPASGTTLAAGASVTVTTTYAPTAAGMSASNLVIGSNGGNVNVPLTGTAGTPPHMVITPLVNDFGTVPLGASETRSFTIANTGGTDLTITKSKPPALGAFVARTTLPEGSVVLAGQSVTETVAFSPSTAGSFTDVWAITGNDTSGLQDVTFTGTAAAPLSRTGWTATASSNVTEAAQALDGNLTTRWTTGTHQVPGQYFEVDMKTAQTFRSITLAVPNSANDYPRGYQVFVSSDGVSFGTAIASGTPTSALVTIDFASQVARYIKIVQTGTTTSWWWSIDELNVYP